MSIYETIRDLTHKTVNGSLKIIFADKNKVLAEVADLTWEDIIDIERALRLAKEVQDGNITLNFKYKSTEFLAQYAENVPHALEKFRFLLAYFVGSFDY